MINKILIIEDNITVANLIKRNIYDNLQIDTVNIAINGFEGIEMIHCYKPHIVILDLSIPGLNGLEILDYFEGLNEYEHINYILITGSPELIRYYNCNIQKILPKPFLFEELIDALNYVLQTNTNCSINSNILSTQEILHRTLKKLGIYTDINAYKYLFDIIYASLENYTLLNSYKSLCDIVTDKHHISITQLNGQLELLNNMAYNSSTALYKSLFIHKSKPNIYEFVAMISDYIRIKYYTNKKTYISLNDT